MTLVWRHHRTTIVRLDIDWSVVLRLGVLRRFFRFLWDQLLSCSSPSLSGARLSYRRLKLKSCFHEPQVDDVSEAATLVTPASSHLSGDLSDVLALKVSLLGDCHIGKTSFMNKYVGEMNQDEQRGLQMNGLNLMDKTMVVRGARIVFSIWDVGGDQRWVDHVPIACKDAVAILIMFDLTTRSTLNNSINWYIRARKWNKTAIPVLIGTKFDDFVQLPLEMQWTIVNEARASAKAMNATLFFSSATHNINVNKIFKFITAKLFNLPWNVERNLTIGEPIIDF
ncbi:putative small monomeric GTPase [Dioscorea sansibarensis]